MKLFQKIISFSNKNYTVESFLLKFRKISIGKIHDLKIDKSSISLTSIYIGCIRDSQHANRFQLSWVVLSLVTEQDKLSFWYRFRITIVTIDQHSLWADRDINEELIKNRLKTSEELKRIIFFIFFFNIEFIKLSISKRDSVLSHHFYYPR